MIFLKDNNNCWTVVVHGDSYHFDSNHPKYTELVNAVISDQEDLVLDTLNDKGKILSWSEGNFELKDGFITYKGRQLENVLSDYVLGMIEKKIDYSSMLKFVENLYLNPSRNVLERLYKFLSHKNFPITPDGHFLGYKAVRSDFLDKHSGKFDNSVGKTVSIDRNEVDENMQVNCSYGLHVGTINYVKGFANHGDKIIIVKVNPADVVAVPYADAQKLRCCKYEVVDLYKEPLDSVYNDDYEEDDDDSGEDDECSNCGSLFCDGECEDEEYDDDDDDSFGW